MVLNRRYLVFGVLLCCFGLWLLLRPTNSSNPNAQTAEPEQYSSASGQSNVESAPLDPDSPSIETSDSDARPAPDEQNSLGSAQRPSGDELDDLIPQTIPPPTFIDPTSTCEPDYQGKGVELRAWGDVLLPYTPGYPTSEPGDVWDCTASTAFGGAIAMTHAAYLDALRPELIEKIALDTVGRRERIRNHEGGNALASLGFRCAPVGWNWDGEDVWTLLHTCGEGELRVSSFQMEYRWDRWWLVYPEDGEIISEPPPPDFQYFAFLGED